MQLMRLLTYTAVLALSLASTCSRADVEDVRVWQSPEYTRLVFDLSQPHGHKIFTLKNPAPGCD